MEEALIRFISLNSAVAVKFAMFTYAHEEKMFSSEHGLVANSCFHGIFDK